MAKYGRIRDTFQSVFSGLLRSDGLKKGNKYSYGSVSKPIISVGRKSITVSSILLIQPRTYYSSAGLRTEQCLLFPLCFFFCGGNSLRSRLCYAEILKSPARFKKWPTNGMKFELSIA